MRTSISNEESAKVISVKRGKYFRWTYIALPVVILLLAVILAVIFYGRLPTEVAYHFSGETPDRWISRGAIIAWMLFPQLFLAFIGIAISGIGSVISRRYELSDSNHIKRILMAMGNMVALPQIILLFAMLEIFLYNAYEIRILPLWIVILAVLLLGTIILGIFFLQTIRHFRRSSVKPNQE